MINKLVVILFLSVFTSAGESPYIKESDIIALGYSSLEWAILNSIGTTDPPNDAGGLIVLLGHIDTDESRELLIKLTNYYLGSATAEALSYSIVKQGNKILPDLKRTLETPVICASNEMTPSKKCLSIESRNRSIQYDIDFINSGKKLDYIL